MNQNNFEFELDVTPFSYCRVRFNCETKRGYNNSTYYNQKRSLGFRLKYLINHHNYDIKANLHKPVEISIIFNCIPPVALIRKKTEPWKEAYNKTKPDLDNYIKAVLDSANGILYVDDCQIVKLTAEKKYDLVPSIIINIKYLT